MNETQSEPQLLILAAPLLREGLDAVALRCVAGCRIVHRLENLEGGPQLVIWAIDGASSEELLRHELEALRARVHPAPVLLLFPANVDIAPEVLLSLPAEGLLQEVEGPVLANAIATLLGGGRVVELLGRRPEAAATAPVHGLGQALLLSGLGQIERERLRCLQTLAASPRNSLLALLLEGRLRELQAARRLLLWLWGPLAMAWPGEPPDQVAQTPRGGNSDPPSIGGLARTAITLRQRTATGVWTSLQERLAMACQGELLNRSGQLLALEGLAPKHRRQLLLALLMQLDRLLPQLRDRGLRGMELESHWQGLQPELRRLALRNMAGEYVQLPREGALVPVAQALEGSATLVGGDPDMPEAQPMLAALLDARPLLIQGSLLAPDEPQALLHLETLLSDWLIRTAEQVSAEVLACSSTWPELRRYLLASDLLATRNLERLRNQLNSQQRWHSWFERPVHLFESRRQLFSLQGEVITVQVLTEPRDGELQSLGWIQQLVTLALESRDALAPQVHGFLRRIGDLVGVLLTQVIGRAIGLVGRGILQGMGRSLSRS